MAAQIKARVAGWLRLLAQFIEQCLDILFKPDLEKKNRWFSLFWFAAIFLLGVFFWGEFFRWGTYPLGYLDWKLVTIPRLTVVQEALRAGTLPLHMIDASAMNGVTDRFFATADVVSTPEMLVLLFIPVSQYILFQVMVLLGLSTLGLLWLRAHYHLSLFAYSVMFVLFNFSGYIQAHLGIGHITWWAYFLLPLVMVLVVQFIENKLNWRWVASARDAGPLCQ